MKATGKNIVVRIPEGSDVSAGGIHMPANRRRASYYRHGTIESVGPRCEDKSLTVGLIVMFRQGLFMSEEACVAVLHEDHVLAIVTKQDLRDMPDKPPSGELYVPSGEIMAPPMS